MRALVLGSGGRESALAWALHRSASVDELVACPGNPGMAQLGEVVDADPCDPQSVVATARRVGAELVVIGPEAPLVAGVADGLREAGYPVFGPGARGAALEGSKAFAKRVMERTNVPTASWSAFDSLEPAARYLDELGPPYVVKADGLAAGKGVVVTESRTEALDALGDCLGGTRFGAAGARVVIEEFLAGQEVSLIALTDGRRVLPLEEARDYKRVHDGDRGPNTGGMGSYSPVPMCPPGLADEITASVLEPVLEALAVDGIDYAGAIYAGLMLTAQGPKVLEFNARFGDPETQALLMRLTSDFGDACRACATGDLGSVRLTFGQAASVCVVLASGGYPGTYRTGLPITGVEAARALQGVEVFHAGTALRDGVLTTAGGRVLAVVALGEDHAAARSRAYEAAALIDFEGKQLRTDIALRVAERRAHGAEVDLSREMT